MKTITVSQNSKADFTSLQQALDTPDQELTIILDEGVYSGQFSANKKYLSITGKGPDKTIITGSIGAKDPFGDGNKTGTFRSYTAYFCGDFLHLENLTVENTAGQGSVAGQAVALYASSSKVFCQNIHLKGFQDTLFTAPLPLKERLKGGFTGPEEFLPRKPSDQCYINCYISGTVDFIFGSASAVFEGCTIAIHKTTTETYITAPSTQPDATGYIFNNCKVVKAEPFDTKEQPSVFLGRPWREYAKCCWLNSDFADVICPAAWDNWDNPENEKTVDFKVYNNKWIHAKKAGVCSFAPELTEEKAQKVLETAEKIISDCKSQLLLQHK